MSVARRLLHMLVCLLLTLVCVAFWVIIIAALMNP